MKYPVLSIVFLLLVACGGSSEPAIGWEDYDATRDQLIALVDEEGPRAALEEVRRQRSGEGILAETCHALVHEIGHAAYQKLGSIPEALAHHDAICNSGYIHGVIERGLLGSTDLDADLLTVCADYDPKSFIGISCIHGIGHGLMYATENNLMASLGLCGELGPQRKGPCENGVFMELFSADRQLHPSDLLKEDDPFQPCPTVPEHNKPYCYLYAPLYYLSLHDHDYAAALDWCAGAEGYGIACAQGVGGLMMNDHLNNPSAVERLCERGPSIFRERCLIGAIRMAIYNAPTPEERGVICEEVRARNRELCERTLEEYEKTFAG